MHLLITQVLGGTSVMNGMTYMRGSRKDYNDWARLGNPGWSYDDVLPYFIKSEDNVQVNDMDYGYHGVGGPLTVTQFPYHPPLSHALLQAGKEMGEYLYIYTCILLRARASDKSLNFHYTNGLLCN